MRRIGLPWVFCLGGGLHLSSAELFKKQLLDRASERAGDQSRCALKDKLQTSGQSLQTSLDELTRSGFR